MQFSAGNSSQFRRCRIPAKAILWCKSRSKRRLVSRFLSHKRHGNNFGDFGSDCIRAAQSQGRDNRPCDWCAIDAPILCSDIAGQFSSALPLSWPSGRGVVVKRQPKAVGRAAGSVADPTVASYASVGRLLWRSRSEVDDAAGSLEEEMFQLNWERRQGKITPFEIRKGQRQHWISAGSALKRQG